jgi:hypothetical protein
MMDEFIMPGPDALHDLSHLDNAFNKNQVRKYMDLIIIFISKKSSSILIVLKSFSASLISIGNSFYLSFNIVGILTQIFSFQ